MCSSPSRHSGDLQALAKLLASSNDHRVVVGIGFYRRYALKRIAGKLSVVDEFLQDALGLALLMIKRVGTDQIELVEPIVWSERYRPPQPRDGIAVIPDEEAGPSDNPIKSAERRAGLALLPAPPMAAPLPVGRARSVRCLFRQERSADWD